MKLAISNIAWDKDADQTVFGWMKLYGFEGLEIAPTRVFPQNPYGNLEGAYRWKEKLKEEYDFAVPSIQSIWFGRTENIFGREEERNILLAYTKSAIDYAEIIECGNLVFGCPKNRNVPEGSMLDSAVSFFKEIGEYARQHHTVIGMEPNPAIYHTNYINDTISALELIEKVNCAGFRLNLDVGTMIQNNEPVDELMGNVKYINHVHISEPHLALIRKRKLHCHLAELLYRENYKGYVSVEMGRVKDILQIKRTLQYIKEVFADA